MLSLYSNQTIRILTISEHLFVHHKELTTKEIEYMNQCSKQTAYDDIDYMLKSWSHHFSITHTGALKSNETSFSDFMHLKRDLLNQENKLKIILAFSFIPYKKIVDYAVLLNLSESYIRNQIEPINKTIAKYGMRICNNSTDHTYYVCSSSELAFAFFMSEIIKISANEHYLNFDDNRDFFLWDALNTKADIVTNKIIKREFKRIGHINLMRTQQNIAHTSCLNELEKIIEKVSLSEDIFRLSLRDFLVDNGLEIETSNFEILIKIFLGTAIKTAICPLRVDTYFNRYNYFFEEYKKSNDTTAKNITRMVKNLSERTNQDFTESLEEIFFHIYTQVNITTKYRSHRIAVYSDMGYEHERVIIMLLKNHFSSHEFFNYVPSLNFDLVLTTTSLLEVSKGEKLTITDFPTSKDIQLIYESLYYKKHS